MNFDIEDLHVADDELHELLSEALDHLDSVRGGFALIRDIMLDMRISSTPEIPDKLTKTSSIIGARSNNVLVGIAGLSPEDHTRVLGIYVKPDFRQQGCAKTMLDVLINRIPAASDGWALPGDRAMKSLYEGAGWRARRLVMSSE